MPSVSSMLKTVLAICGWSLILATGSLQAQWRPITPAELSLKPPQSDPDADVEALFRDVRLLNEAATFGYPHNVISEYIRLKIFTDRGRDKYGTIVIPYWGKSIVSNIEGRTINPDGSVIELKRDSIFEKVIQQKRGALKLKAVSFAMPAVQAGSIVEYRFTRNVGEFISRYVPLDVQSEFPVDELTFHIKPVSGVWVKWPPMRIHGFGCDVGNMTTDAAGFSNITLRNIPAFHEEPYMLPEYSSKQWILLFYEENENVGTDRYWPSVGREEYKQYSLKLKVNGEARSIASEVIAGAATDDEKITRLLEYCRKNLKNIRGTEISTQQREQAKENRTAVNTLRRKEGTAQDIDFAFAALASAAGFDARPALLTDRSRFMFTPALQSRFFLDTTKIAVKVNDKWQFYDPTDHSLAPGQLRWQEQGVMALIADPKDPQFVTTPLLPAEKSAVQHVGALKLSLEGALEGDVRQYYLGNKAASWRERFGLANDAERENALREELKHRFPEFELTGVTFNVPPDLTKGIGVYYHIVVPRYAQRTGKRMFVMPGFFEAGFNALFVDIIRRQPIYFDYPWSEVDSLELQLPEGYQLDHPNAPSPINVPSVLAYSVAISVTNTNKLIYRREFSFGGNKIPLFDSKAYPALKQVFDTIHDGDNHILTLKAESQASAATHQ